jgi:Zn-dependent M16 (insulinase) family peptidase
VKEPFLELMKNSMNTFLNAMTFPDKTCYPIASRNNKDFINLMRVYLDAVFCPSIYSKPEIFCQEGWHYDFDENGVPSYKGVVFNEMKGAMASADELMMDGLMKMLFPDNCYSFNSGGDPTAIPDLSYEQFIESHRRFYSPSNAFILLDGDVDLEQVLTILEEEYLSRFPRGERIAPPVMQRAVNAGEKTIVYELGQDEDPASRWRVAWGNVIGDYSDRLICTAMQILAGVLTSGNHAPLTKCILEKGLAEDVSLSVQDGMLQTVAVLDVQNCRQENLELIGDTIRAGWSVWQTADLTVSRCWRRWPTWNSGCGSGTTAECPEVCSWV